MNNGGTAGAICCDECGRAIQSWIMINGRKCCDWCKPVKEQRVFAEPIPMLIQGKTIDDLYGRLVAIESRLKGIEEHLYSKSEVSNGK